MNPEQSLSDAGYSPNIAIELRVGSEVFDVASLDNHRFTLRNPRSLMPQSAVIHLTIDKSLRAFAVNLIDGIDPSRASHAYERIKANMEAVA